MAIYAINYTLEKGTETPSDYKITNEVSIPPNDSFNLTPDGILVLETAKS